MTANSTAGNALQLPQPNKPYCCSSMKHMHHPASQKSCAAFLQTESAHQTKLNMLACAVAVGCTFTSSYWHQCNHQNRGAQNCDGAPPPPRGGPSGWRLNLGASIWLTTHQLSISKQTKARTPVIANSKAGKAPEPSHPRHCSIQHVPNQHSTSSPLACRI